MELDKQQIKKLRDRIDLYFMRTEELRAANKVQRDDVYGDVFSYRIEGTDNTVGIWNFRRATPPQMMEMEGVPLMHLHERVHPQALPSRYPETGDICIVDVKAEKFFDKLMAGSHRTWGEMHAKFREKYPSFYAYTDTCFSRVLVGEIPWELLKVSAEDRNRNGWSIFDLDGDPWVSVGLSSLSIKSDRLRYSARLEMKAQGLESAQVFEGIPGALGSASTSKTFPRIPEFPEEPNPEFGEIRPC